VASGMVDVDAESACDEARQQFGIKNSLLETGLAGDSEGCYLRSNALGDESNSTVVFGPGPQEGLEVGASSSGLDLALTPICASYSRSVTESPISAAQAPSARNALLLLSVVAGLHVLPWPQQVLGPL
jgi:hypothetical protein